jgi:hypothetical protein
MPDSKDPHIVSGGQSAEGHSYESACAANLISASHFSAKSSQRGFTFSMSAIFFERLQPFSCFSRAMAFRTLSNDS